MANASYMQSSFLAGRWSQGAQGRLADPSYKAALNECLNYYPLEQGSLTRRQGLRCLGPTRQGQKAYLRAFDFSIIQPYQMEFTPDVLRLWAGLGLVQEADGTLNVSYIDTASNIFLVQPIPDTWNAGDTVIVNVLSSPCSTKQICNRQLQIVSIDDTNNSINVVDAITQAALGNIGFVPSGGADQIFKIFEMTTPYGAADLAGIRTVQDYNSVLILHSGYQPRSMTAAANPTPFAISTQTFLDGPYLTENQTATTLTLSNITGTVTVTASSTVGINGGDGFKSTDVGRHIRFMSGWPEWDSTVTYIKNAKVTGSDDNLYTSLVGGNLDHDPTTDDGTHWRISTTIATWCWLVITAFTDNKHVSALVMDETQVTDPNCLSESPWSLNSSSTATAASENWMLGAFSNTTGWPTCGCYHEGRLWLAGNMGNWLYASYANDHFTFTPTAADGTVSDANGMSLQLNANDVNNPFWLLSTDQGIIMSTQAAEWLIYSSVGDNAITPDTVAAKRVSTYGGSDIEPIIASVVGFVQRNQTRVLAHAPLIGGKFFADNLSELADDLCAPGIEEIRWQQTPNLTIWARRSDGALLGTTFQKMPLYSAYQSKNGSFTAWHHHAHGQGRVFESISCGPSFNGISDTLYAVTNNTDNADSDYNVRHVECLMPLFDDAAADWSSFFVDGGYTPCCGIQRAIANGDSFNGIQLYGANNLVGQSVAPVLGALDLGDTVVASDGSVSIAYGADPESAFTESFWQNFSNSTDYGEMAGTITYTTIISLPNTPIGQDTLNAYADASADPGYSADIAILDGANDKVYLAAEGDFTASPAANLRRLGATTGADELTNTLDQVYSNLNIAAWNSSAAYTVGQRVLASDGHYYFCLGDNTNHDPAGNTDDHWAPVSLAASGARTLGVDGNLYLSVEFANTTPIAQVDPTTLEANWIFGLSGSGLSSSSGGLVASAGFATIPGALISASSVNAEVACMTTGTSPVFVGAVSIDENRPFICVSNAVNSGGMVYGIGVPSIGVGTTSPFGVYAFFGDVGGLNPNFQKYKAGTISPSQVDATWTHFTAIKGPAYDQRDDTIIVYVATADAVTNQYYLVKINPHTCAIVWTLALPGSLTITAAEMNQAILANSRYCFLETSSHVVYEVHTDTGTLVTYTSNSGLSPTGGQQYDDISASITFYGGWTSPGTGPTMTEIGVYLTANPGSFSSKWARLYIGGNNLGRTAPSTVTYTIPVSAGFAYTSQGQLLRPDTPQDSGARNGPGFGKKRRNHWWAGLFHRARRVFVGTDFANTLNEAQFGPFDGAPPNQAPILFSGVWSTPINDDESWDGRIAWQQTRPYPCLIAAMGGFVVTADK